jgi:hypothetical protein
MQKAWPLALIAVALVVAWAATATLSRPPAAPSTDQAAWQTYTDPGTGFSISYPPQYAVYVSTVASGTPWGSRTLLSIYNPSNTSRGEFDIGPASVVLVKQPVGADGAIYHAIADYQSSGAAAVGMQGVPDPNGELTSVNGMQALIYHFPEGDATDAPVDEYVFMHDDLIYRVALNANDPSEQGMLASITWR